jgi:hypothetical protein
MPLGVTPGDYLLQVQDANLNNNQQLYSVDSNSFFTTIEECKYTNFGKIDTFGNMYNGK